MSTRRVKRLHRDLWRSVLDRAAELYLDQGAPEVLGLSVGPKLRRGRKLPFNTLRVLVDLKRAAPARPLPDLEFQHDGQAYVLTPDVVPVGRIRTVSGGGRPEYTGLHPGCPIFIDGDPPMRGGVASLMGEAGALTHLITAGHLFSAGATGCEVLCAASPGDDEVVAGALEVNLLDQDLGLGHALDLAAVKLTAAGRELARSSGHGGPPRFEDFLDLGDAGMRQAQAFRPTLNDYSARVTTRYEPNVLAVGWTDVRQGYQVRDVVTTSGAITVGGDSGTCLSTAASPRWAMGVCVGADLQHSYFEPLARGLEYLQPLLRAEGSLDQDLEVWPAS